jgi:hypothetical protein
MTPQLTKAEYAGEYRIKVIFEDGVEGVVNMENELWGEVFEPLKDLSEFQNFVLDKELRTIVWPSTGADLAPEFLYEKAAA